MRGLKQADLLLNEWARSLASITDAWIETLLRAELLEVPFSHPSRMRGLKPLNIYTK